MTHRRRLLVIGATAVVFAAVVVVQVWGPWRRTVVTNAVAVPAVYQVVSFHGVTLTVPGSWAVGTFTCTNPDRSAVLIEGWSGISCPATSGLVKTPADATVLSLGDLSAQTPRGDPVTVAGNPGRLFVDTSGQNGPPYAQWQLPAAGVLITVTGPGVTDPDVLTGLRYTPVDGNGCAATIAHDPVPATLPAGRVTLPKAVSVTVCDYAPLWGGHGGWLVGSRLLTPEQIPPFVATVNGAPPWADPPDIYGQLQGDDLIYRLTLPDTSTRTVVAQAIGAAMAVSDGEHRVAIPSNSALPSAWSN